MEMDKLGVVTTFIHNIVVYNIPLLYGTVGEIVVEKSGSLNLGVEGIMAVGAIFGYIIGCYANSLLVGILTAFLFGALCGLLFAFVMDRWFGGSIGYGSMAVLALACGVVAQVGDLSFSLIKREFGIKDYGHLFLAHGGVLDRFDSVLFVTPVIEIILSFVK